MMKKSISQRQAAQILGMSESTLCRRRCWKIVKEAINDDGKFDRDKIMEIKNRPEGVDNVLRIFKKHRCGQEKQKIESVERRFLDSLKSLSKPSRFSTIQRNARLGYENAVLAAKNLVEKNILVYVKGFYSLTAQNKDVLSVKKQGNRRNIDDLIDEAEKMLFIKDRGDWLLKKHRSFVDDLNALHDLQVEVNQNLLCFLEEVIALSELLQMKIDDLEEKK